ncbi:uncharacterized protein LODBEIA_P51540 [Lodderomyces beijingensis]|uniref:Inhibitor of growth protein N-terminal histone-binding domain-containing protein n=1 Tax=Lodderomyces beijingensis TaxID=1775926 RepID=A0ABP0ZS02_9ASCO
MFRFDQNGGTSRPKLPNSIKIDDITSGRIDPKLIYEEIERLKAEINILRNDMSSFLKALATIPENGSQQEYYGTVILRLQTMQQSINEYCERYNKLLPIINLAQIKLGHEVEAPAPALKGKLTPSNPSTTNNTPVMGSKTTPVLTPGTPSLAGTNFATNSASASAPGLSAPTSQQGTANGSSKNLKKPAKKAISQTTKTGNGTAASPIVL